jgi:ribosomal protein S18 acetylase RimI-like enzyme
MPVLPAMPKYQTRPAKHEDEPFLYSCYKRVMYGYVQETWGWDEEFQKAAFAKYLPWQQFEIITIDSSTVGAACVLDTPSGIELEMIIIEPQFQRIGIGSDFVGRLLRRARKENRSVRLRVMKVNPAKSLYERLGFVAVGEDAGIIEMQAQP